MSLKELSHELHSTILGSLIKLEYYFFVICFLVKFLFIIILIIQKLCAIFSIKFYDFCQAVEEMLHFLQPAFGDLQL